MSATTQWYQVAFYAYQYNTGRGDNGEYLQTLRFDDYTRAENCAALIKAILAGRDRYPYGQTEKQHCKSAAFVANNTGLGPGHLTRFRGLFEITSRCLDPAPPTVSRSRHADI